VTTSSTSILRIDSITPQPTHFIFNPATARPDGSRVSIATRSALYAIRVTALAAGASCERQAAAEALTDDTRNGHRAVQACGNARKPQPTAQRMCMYSAHVNPRPFWFDSSCSSGFHCALVAWRLRAGTLP
jgi:hypothetical protein